MANKKLHLLLPVALLVSLAIGVWWKQQPPAPLLTTTKAESRLPDTILWAWERPERLTFLDTSKIGVAFLAKTLALQGTDVASRPRLQTLQLLPRTKVVAVVRIESDRAKAPTLSDTQLAQVTREIFLTSQLPDLLAIQIDFDAKASEREFYRRLLFRLREQLPKTIALSITALASWCDGDNWLSGLPIDEAVPMLFRMGVDGRQFRTRLNSGEDPFTGPCKNAAGVSTDEPINLPQRRRLYIFSPEPWTTDSLASALETYSR